MTLTDCSAIDRTTGGRNRLALLLGAGLIAGLQVLFGPAAAGPGEAASAALMNAEGEPVGTVELTQTENGTAIVTKLENLPEGRSRRSFIIRP
jgi:Cu/Zn superoxide dismutase